ncbi:MAG TPA: hypothetical protein VJ907_02300 [Halanaerobiales bacterium]|nr:hypothetical protein [Halanaerobiales bacterium]
MDRKEFIIEIDDMSDRKLRQLLNFVYEQFEKEDKVDLLKDKIDEIKKFS